MKWIDRQKETNFLKQVRQKTQRCHLKRNRARFDIRTILSADDQALLCSHLDALIQDDWSDLPSGLQKGPYVVLKADRKSQVLAIPEQGWVVKKSVLQGPSWWVWLKTHMMPTRAERSWWGAHRLLFWQIPTPAPLAWVECELNRQSHVSFYVMSHVDLIPATQWIQTQPVALKDKLNQLLKGLAKARLIHGDLKLPNVFVQNDRLWLIDLDAMHRPFCFWTTCKRDEARLLRSFNRYQAGYLPTEEPS